jgi:hypothetical protein
MLKRYKSPGTHQIPAEVIQAGSSTMHSEIQKRISSKSEEELAEQWKELIILPDETGGECLILFDPEYFVS